MAALLKKRAVAEFSQGETKVLPPPKKLRLVQKPKTAEPVLDLQRCTNKQQILQALLNLEQNLPVGAEHAEQIVQTLLTQFHSESDSSLRAKIATLLGKVSLTPGYSGSMLLEDITTASKHEESHSVLSQLIWSAMCKGRTQPANSALAQQCLQLAREHLHDSSHQVRCKCLELIGTLGSPEQKVVEGRKSLQCILGDFMQDTDCRVRNSAFQAVLMWHQRGLRLEESVYGQACHGLHDDYEGVRVAAVRLIWVLSQLYPESIITVLESEESLRLMDDGFAHICDMVNDVSVKVRAEAATLLGSLHGVSQKFLEQTLDKKLMSNMRRKTSAHERQKSQYQSGEWSTGKKWADDAPKEDLDPENVSLMSSGSCGAFVHGLEDEFLEVRNAAIDSICELASKSTGFAQQSQDFLVDMFNDEIESVRLNAINSLRKMSSKLVLREDQVEIMLGVLQDFSFEIREALHGLFCGTRLGTKSCLYQCILALLGNLQRYPQDRQSIWSCMRHLGANHPAHTLPMVPDLLSMHPHFESMEPDVDDPSYIGILILVFNAAVNSSTMPALFPEHTIRHYSYLRDTLPELVPRLELPGISFLETRSSTERSTSPTTFLSQTIDRLSDLSSMDSDGAQQLMLIGIRDLERVEEMSENLSATARCLSMYLQCQLCLAEAMSRQSWATGNLVPSHHSQINSSLLNKVLTLTHHVEHLFVGMSTANLATIKQLRLRAQSLQLLVVLRKSAQGQKSACIQYLQILNQLDRLLKTSKVTPDCFTQSLLTQMNSLETCEPAVYLSMIQSALLLHQPMLLQLDSCLSQAKARIIEPAPHSDNPVRFIAGLATGVDLIAELTGISNLENIRVQVKYPDQRVYQTKPREADFRQQGPFSHRLITKVLLSHSLWSGSSPVALSIVLCYSPDKEIVVDKEKTDAASTALCHVELSKAIQVLLAPQHGKR